MSKRANIFAQGKPERPYDEREEDPADIPQLATAAQMATRKIKTVRKRTPGVSSGLSGLGGLQQNSGPASGRVSPAPPESGTNDSNANSNPFGSLSQGGGAFGVGANHSFPPARSTTPSNSFANSSFPAFGGGNDANPGGFNPQPPSGGFSFSAGAKTPFGAATENTENTNGAFSGSIFNFQQPQQPQQPQQSQQSGTFGGFGQNNNTSSAAPAFGGSSSAAPTPNIFGFGSGTQNNETAVSSVPQTSTFGGLGSASQATTSAFGFGSGSSNIETATSSAPQNNIFGGFGAASKAPTSPFAFGSGAQNTENATTTAAQNNTFGGFGATSQPTTSMFGLGSGAQNTETAASTTAQNNNTFGEFGATSQPTTSLFGFGPGAQNTETATSTATQTKTFGGFGAASQPTSNAFGGFGSGAQNTDSATSTTAQNNTFGGFTSTSQPAGNMFGGFGSGAQTTDAPTSTAAQNTFGGFSATSKPANNTTPAPYTFGSFGSGAPQMDTSTSTPAQNNIFGGFNATSQGAESIAHPASQSTASDGVATTTQEHEDVSMSSPSKSNNTSSVINTSENGNTPKATPFSGFQLGAKKTEPTSKLSPSPAPSNSLFGSPQFSVKKSETETTPKAKQWSFGTQQSGGPFDNGQNTPMASTNSSNIPNTQSSSSSRTPSAFDSINSKKRLASAAPLSNTPHSESEEQPSAPSSQDKSTAFARRGQSSPSMAAATPFAQTGIVNKPSISSAAMPNLTGASAPSEASTTSESPKIQKAHVPKEWNRPASHLEATQPVEVHYTQTIKSLSEQLNDLNVLYRSKLNNLSPSGDWSSLSKWHFTESKVLVNETTAAKKAKAMAKGITGHESSLSTKRKDTDESDGEERRSSPSKKARPTEEPSTPTPKSSISFSTTPTANPPATQTSQMFGNILGNKTSSSTFGSLKTNAASQPPNTGANLMNQFSKGTKSQKELTAERKAKAKAEDYDSDEETEEAWSARWDKEEAERVAQEKKQLQSASGFKFSGPSKEPDSAKPAFNPFATASKPASGSSTPSIFESRLGSPALPTSGGQSVLNTPTTAQSPSANIFRHLSPAGSNNDNNDESDEDEQTETDASATSTQPEPSTPAPSLVSRMSKMTEQEAEQDNKVDAEAEKAKKTSENFSFLGQANGVQTPKKPFEYFDFGAAAAKSAPPKSETFAGDQTYKEGSPIKFGAPATEKKAGPSFQFQPATPTPADFSKTPTQQSPFSFLNQASNPPNSLAPNTSQSAAASKTSSVFTSRAQTPASEAETSAQGSAAETEDDDEEESGHEPVDRSSLTAEELQQYEVVFKAENSIAKKYDNGLWVPIARGPLYLLKDRVTGKGSIRIRLTSGATPVNYTILPNLRPKMVGDSAKQVQSTWPPPSGGLQTLVYSFRQPELAIEFMAKLNEYVPTT